MVSCSITCPRCRASDSGSHNTATDQRNDFKFNLRTKDRVAICQQGACGARFVRDPMSAGSTGTHYQHILAGKKGLPDHTGGPNATVCPRVI